MRQLAIRMCLSDKAQHDNLLVLEAFNFTAPKTKLLSEMLSKLPKRKSLLILTAGKNEMLFNMAKNLPRVKVFRAEDTNVMELLNKEAILTSKDGVAKLEQVFAK